MRLNSCFFLNTGFWLTFFCLKLDNDDTVLWLSDGLRTKIFDVAEHYDTDVLKHR